MRRLDDDAALGTLDSFTANRFSGWLSNPTVTDFRVLAPVDELTICMATLTGSNPVHAWNRGRIIDVSRLVVMTHDSDSNWVVAREAPLAYRAADGLQHDLVPPSAEMVEALRATYVTFVNSSHGHEQRVRVKEGWVVDHVRGTIVLVPELKDFDKTTKLRWDTEVDQFSVLAATSTAAVVAVQVVGSWDVVEMRVSGDFLSGPVPQRLLVVLFRNANGTWEVAQEFEL